MTSIATRILGISLVLGSAGFTVACDDGGDGGGGGTGGLPTASGGATGTGGAAPGTGGAAPGTGGSAPAEGCNIGTGTGTFTRDAADGRFVSGTATGYGFAYISPSEGATAIACDPVGDTDTAICASGMVPAEATYAAVAGIGVNVNQEGGEGTTPGAYASQVTGLTVNYIQNGTSELRVQVSNGTVDYCAKLDNAATSKALVPADFNSHCWDPTLPANTVWDGNGLVSVQLITPSKDTASVPFDACLTGFTITP